MASFSTRDFVLEVIESYKQHPCLWQVTNVDYHNKQKRNDALDAILPIFRRADPLANRETVQKKLSSIRGSYNKELRKIKASMTNGSDSQNVRIPKLWYFNNLSFLQDQQSTKKSKMDLSEMDDIPLTLLVEEDEGSDPLDEEGSSSSQNSSSSFRQSRNLRRPQPKVDKVLEKIAKRMEQPPAIVEKPKRLYDAYGEHIAEKLRSLPTSMVPYVQKVMNDAIFLGEMNHLNMSSRIVTDQINPPSSTTKQKKDSV